MMFPIASVNHHSDARTMTVVVNSTTKEREGWLNELSRQLAFVLPGAAVNKKEYAAAPYDLIVGKSDNMGEVRGHGNNLYAWYQLDAHTLNQLLGEIPETTFLAMARSKTDQFVYTVACNHPVSAYDHIAVREIDGVRHTTTSSLPIYRRHVMEVYAPGVERDNELRDQIAGALEFTRLG